MTWSLALKAWRNRKDKEAILKLKSSFSRRSAWSYIQEVEVIEEQHAAKNNKIHIPNSQLLPSSRQIMVSAASYNKPEENVDKLFDDDPKTFWHVSSVPMPPETWVMIDFGEGKIVRSLAARPRKGHPEQFFHQAQLFGSADGETWESVSLITQPELSRTNDWLIGTLPIPGLTAIISLR